MAEEDKHGPPAEVFRVSGEDKDRDADKAAPLKKTKVIGDAFFGDDSTSDKEDNDIPSNPGLDNLKVSKSKNLGTAKDKRSEKRDQCRGCH